MSEAENFFSELLDAKDIHVFLQIYVQLSPGPVRGKLSAINSNAGFSSTSFLSEILSGKKGLSRDSLQRLKSALKVPAFFRKHFELLGWQKYPRCRPKSMTDFGVEMLIRQHRAGYQDEYQKLRAKTIVNSSLHHPYIFKVYAALSTPEMGATVDEIVQKSRVEKPLVENAIEILLKHGAVVRKKMRYFASLKNADSFDLSDVEGHAFLIREVSQEVARLAKKNLANPATLNLYSAFSIRAQDQSVIKRKIKEAIMTILDHHQSDDGDTVKQVFVNFW